MEKVNGCYMLFFLILFCSLSNSFAQENVIIKKGLLRTQSTLSPSYNFTSKNSYFYLHGAFEAYLESSVSIAGETYYYLGSLDSGNELFEFNHAVFFGASKHFVSKNNDLYVGIQPGVSITKIRNILESDDHQIGANPLFSGVMGYNYFVSKYFHFFIEARLIAGQHHYDMYQNLSEARISAGLGLNINSLK
jgi:hypothetical protein